MSAFSIERRTMIDLELESVALHRRAKVYSEKLEASKYLRNTTETSIRKMYECILQNDPRLNDVILEEYVKRSTVEPTLFIKYRVFCEASARSSGLQRMVDETVSDLNITIDDWKILRDFESESYVSSVDGFESVLRSSFVS